MANFLSEAQIMGFRLDGFLFPLDCMSPEDGDQRRQWIEAYEHDIGEDASRLLRMKSFLAFPWIVEMVRHPNMLGALRHPTS